MQDVFTFASYQVVYRPVQDIWLYLVTAAVLEALALYSWRYRKTPAALNLAVAFVCQATWLVSLVLLAASPGAPEKGFFAKTQQLSSIVLAYLFPVLVLQLFSHQQRITRFVAAGSLVALLFSGLALLSNEWHGLFWREALWDGKNFIVFPGPFLVAARCFGILAVLAGFFLGIRLAFFSAGLRRWQVCAFLLGPAFVASGYALWILAEKAYYVSPMPMGFLLSGVLWAWIFWWLRVFNLNPLAQAAITRDMDEALIVIDDSDYIVEVNPAARKMFGSHSVEPIGRKYPEIFACWPQLLERIVVCEEIAEERIIWDDADRRGHFQVHAMLLRGWRGRIIGRAVVIRNVTVQVQAEMLLLEQQKAMSILTERNRLGRELHDGPGQLGGYVNMQLEAARSLLAVQNFTQVDAILKRLTAVIQDAHADIRDSITRLQYTFIAERGLWQSLENYLQWLRQNYGMDSQLSIDSNFSAGLISPVVELQLLRIIQEALANVRKHAGARHVQVQVFIHAGYLEVRVEDDGKGFDTGKEKGKSCNYGLEIMRERADEIGAQFSIESIPLSGTAVVVKAPLWENLSGENSKHPVREGERLESTLGG